MKSRILGFKEKNKIVYGRPSNGEWLINRYELVPVVSVEWLEAWMNENRILRSPNINGLNLLEAVRLQARVPKEIVVGTMYFGKEESDVIAKQIEKEKKEK